MKIDFRIIPLKKRFPLAISRVVRKDSDNLFLSVTKDGISGWGEMAPEKSEGADTPEAAIKALEQFFQPAFADKSVREIHTLGRKANLPSCALAALDIALWDWLGKKAGLPLYRLLGFGKPTIPTSVTIGINTPKVVKERIPLLLQGTSIKALKIKLGSSEGIQADQSMFAQVVESAAPYPVKIRVDANGGWNVDEAILMMKWLADLGVDYIEQPLAQGAEKDLPLIFKNRPLPIFVDESIHYAQDIPALADCVDGVNLKLMKCGGITGALQIIETAKAFKLKTMIGCMGESSLSIAAGAAVSGAIDHIDLDSHLNLAPDPCSGAALENGIIMPTEQPGHGAYIKE